MGVRCSKNGGLYNDGSVKGRPLPGPSSPAFAKYLLNEQSIKNEIRLLLTEQSIITHLQEPDPLLDRGQIKPIFEIPYNTECCGLPSCIVDIIFDYLPPLQFVLSADVEGCISIWSSINGECLQTIQTHTCAIRVLTVINDNLIIAGYTDGRIHIYNMHNSQCIQIFQAHNSLITRLLVVNSNIINNKYDQLISAASDGSIKIWNNKQNQQQIIEYDEIQNIQAHSEIFNGICMITAPNLDVDKTNLDQDNVNNNQTLIRLISGGGDGAIRVFTWQPKPLTKSNANPEIKENEVVTTDDTSNHMNGSYVLNYSIDRAHNGCVYCLSTIDPVNHTIASGGTGNDDSIKLWKIESNQAILLLHFSHRAPLPMLLCAFSPDILAVASVRHDMCVWRCKYTTNIDKDKLIRPNNNSQPNTPTSHNSNDVNNPNDNININNSTTANDNTTNNMAANSIQPLKYVEASLPSQTELLGWYSASGMNVHHLISLPYSENEIGELIYEDSRWINTKSKHKLRRKSKSKSITNLSNNNINNMNINNLESTTVGLDSETNISINKYNSSNYNTNNNLSNTSHTVLVAIENNITRLVLDWQHIHNDNRNEEDSSEYSQSNNNNIMNPSFHANHQTIHENNIMNGTSYQYESVKIAHAVPFEAAIFGHEHSITALTSFTIT